MRYPSDLTDAEWQILMPLLPSSSQSGPGRPRTRDLREILNAIFYVLRSGCAWRMLPRDLPPFQTAYYYLRKWRKDGTWEKIHEVLRGDLHPINSRPCRAYTQAVERTDTAAKGARSRRSPPITLARSANDWK